MPCNLRQEDTLFSFSKHFFGPRHVLMHQTGTIKKEHPMIILKHDWYFFCRILLHSIRLKYIFFFNSIILYTLTLNYFHSGVFFHMRSGHFFGALKTIESFLLRWSKENLYKKTSLVIEPFDARRVTPFTVPVIGKIRSGIFPLFHLKRLIKNYIQGLNMKIKITFS
jgi:hypothetical protein